MGTMKAESPRCPFDGSVLAKTTVQAAWPALEMNVLEPFRTYSSPRRSALVLMRATSEPASGSLSPNEQRIGSSRSGVSQSRFCSSRACEQDRPGAEGVGRQGNGHPGAAPRELLADQDALEGGEAQAAVLLGDVNVHQPELVGLDDHVGRVGRRARRTRPPSAGSPSRRTRARARAAPSARPSARTRRPSRSSPWWPLDSRSSLIDSSVKGG